MSKAIFVGIAAGAIGAAAVIAIAVVAVHRYTNETPQEVCEGTIRVLQDTMIGLADEAEMALIPFTYFSLRTSTEMEQDPRVQELRAQLNVLHGAYDQKNGPPSPEKDKDLRNKISKLENQIRQIFQELNDADVRAQADQEMKDPLDITFDSTPRALKYDPSIETTWCAVRWSLNRESSAGIRRALGQSSDPKRETIYSVQLNGRTVPLVTLLESKDP